MKIGFDLDGVIINTYDVMEDRLYREFGVHFPKETHDQFKFDIPGVDWMEIQRVIDDCMINDMLTAEPLNNSIEFLEELYYTTKKPLFFITARPSTSKDGTEKWLKKHLKDIPFCLFLTGNGHKNFYIEVNSLQYFVDDRFKTCMEVSPIVKKVFLFDSPWNQRPITKSNVVRIKNLDEIFIEG